MTSYGVNPQGGQMAPLDLEVGETCALGHMGGGADGVRAFGFKYGCGNSRSIFTVGGQFAMCLSAMCHDSSVVQEIL